MPFTVAHAAAAIPLKRPLGRFGVLSALVIGAMTPDLVYFHAGLEWRHYTHSLKGILTYCLPVGLIVYLTYHWVMKQPLIALFPSKVESKLRRLVAERPPRTAFHWLAVSVSVLVGAGTHLLWDAFTHRNDFGVRALPFLATEVYSLAGYRVFVFSILQHLSTVLGLSYVAYRAGVAFQRLAPAQTTNEAHPNAIVRTVLITVVVGTSVTLGALAGLQAVSGQPPVPSSYMLLFIAKAGLVTISAFCCALIVFCICWLLQERLRKHGS